MVASLRRRLSSLLQTRILPGLGGPRSDEQQVSLLIWAGVMGALGSLLAILLRLVGDTLAPLLWQGEGADIVSLVGSADIWRRLALPAAGGIAAGLLLVYGLRVTRGASGWDILEAVVLRDGILKFRPALIKTLSSLLTTVTGGAVGREGPMVLMSATVASKLGQWRKMPTRRLRILTACGVASGIAAAYNAPIGAALFAMEIILGNFAMEVFAPLVFASVIATLVSRGLYGAEPIFHLPAFEMISAWEVVAYLVLGICGGLVASAFLGSLRGAARLFAAARLPRPLAMGLVGLALGCVVVAYPEVCGGGRGLTDTFLDVSQMWKLAAALLVLKLLLTAFTVGSGAVGGVLTPSLFVGAALGSAFGTAVQAVAPGSTAGPGAYAVIGMGCLLAGTSHAPIMAILLIFEMTLDYSAVLPLMLSCVAASLVARSLSPASLYTEALERKGAAIPSTEAQVMTSLTVSDIMRRDFEAVPPAMPLPQVLDRFIKSRRNHLYVVDKEGVFVGAISLHDLKEALAEAEEVSFVLAADLVRQSFECTVPGEHLDRVMERLWSQDAERIPVVDSTAGRRLIGTVSKRDILGVYTLEVLHRKTMMTRFQPTTAGDKNEATYVELPAHYQVEGVTVAASLTDRTLAEARLREIYGVTVLMVLRRGAGGGEARIVPEPGTRLCRGDRLVVFGPDDGINRLRQG